MYEVNYYEDARGRRPVEEFIDGLPAKMRAKVFGRLELLEEHGPALGMPFSRHLDDGIFEAEDRAGKRHHAGPLLLRRRRGDRAHPRLRQEDAEDPREGDRAGEEDARGLEVEK